MTHVCGGDCMALLGGVDRVCRRGVRRSCRLTRSRAACGRAVWLVVGAVAVFVLRHLARRRRAETGGSQTGEQDEEAQ
jgi:hypothetical protein